jgi:hypothetical protein
MLGILSNTFITATRMDAFSFVPAPTSDARFAHETSDRTARTMSLSARALTVLRRLISAIF